jgi:hypothetical protein
MAAARNTKLVMFETVGGSSLNFGSFESSFQSGSATNLSRPDSSEAISGKRRGQRADDESASVRGLQDLEVRTVRTCNRKGFSGRLRNQSSQASDLPVRERCDNQIESSTEDICYEEPVFGLKMPSWGTTVPQQDTATRRTP